MEALNQTWEKSLEGKMVLVHEERVQVPDPDPGLEERIALLEARVKEILGIAHD